ncbi:PREDICTED: leukocyte surface antigen CD47-like isoform X2 [Chinchilla lanigera]|uniref:leukocyte surface antigen CD47-like isoform X2 n=1 Tax=Chinchilla lanigera TaxID=34839 RepID=UPI00038E9F9C|nr:PREDICTED: leukocyte surface antigen CD47-like isoform X2 [Chinchilla lanigera]
MDKDDAKLGTYTCEVTELSREGETMIELEYRSVSWFPSKEYTLIIALPIVAITLFWAQVGFIMLKYKHSLTDKNIIILSLNGLLLITAVILGTLFFTPGEYSQNRVRGLHFLVSPSVMLVLLQFYRVTPACVAAHGPLLISGLIIIALVELFGLVYLIFMVPEI